MLRAKVFMLTWCCRWSWSCACRPRRGEPRWRSKRCRASGCSRPHRQTCWCYNVHWGFLNLSLLRDETFIREAPVNVPLLIADVRVKLYQISKVLIEPGTAAWEAPMLPPCYAIHAEPWKSMSRIFSLRTQLLPRAKMGKCFLPLLSWRNLKPVLKPVLKISDSKQNMFWNIRVWNCIPLKNCHFAAFVKVYQLGSIRCKNNIRLQHLSGDENCLTLFH